MTPIEDLLRQALQDAPTPPVSGDPLGQIAQRARRAWLQIAAAAGIVAAVVAIAVVVPLVLVDGGTRSSPVLIKPSPKSTTPTARPWPVHNAVAATTTVDGSVWILQRSRSIDHATVVQHNRTGEVIRRVDIPGPARGIAAGAGAVWTYGGGDGAAPNGVLNRIGPRGDVATARFTGSGPYDIAFVDGTTFVTLASADRVVAVAPDGQGRLVETASVQLPSQVTDIVSTDNGQVWVREDLARRVVRVVSDGHALRAGRSFPWQRGLLGPGPNDGIWTADQPNRLIGLSPEAAARGSFSIAEGYRILTPGAISGVPVVGNGFRGGSVVTSRGIAYYADFDAAAQTDPSEPTALLRQKGIVGLAAAPDGGVLAVLGSGRVVAWDPTASP